MPNPGERFVWPPRRPVDTPGNSHEVTPPAREQREPTRLRAAILEIERTWLGLETPPMRDRMAEAGWTPDASTAYCSRCGATVGMHEADDTGCSRCRGRRWPWDRIVRLGEFQGLLREMILEVKFTRWRRLGLDLGRLLGESLGPVIEAEGLSTGNTVLVPVPISMRRRLERGIDHAMVIARGVSMAVGMPIARGLKRRHRPAQSRLPRGERRSNIAGSIMPRFGLGNMNVIVVDDVTTTRATLRAACRAVQAGRKVLGDKGEGRILAAVLGVTPDRSLGGRG